MIDSNREEFEKLPEIAKIIKEHDAFYCNKGEWYLCPDDDQFAEAYLDGAWYAFQEQQKKLDCCREENKALLIKLNIPVGYKLVPVEPTYDMQSAAWEAKAILNTDVYKAMIGAAP